jgi:hypothetical protein
MFHAIHGILAVLGTVTTPLRVVVTKMPGPDAYAVASVDIALIALGVAVVTLLAVLKQISIATEELKAVKDDFALAQRQFKEVTRRPKLTVGVELLKPETNYDFFRARFVLTNRGDKMSRSLMAELWVEEKHFAALGVGHQPDRRFVQRISEDSDINYMVFGLTIELPLYPNGVALPVSFSNMTVRHGVETSKLFFRVYDENFAYPEEGYGSVEFFQSKPTPMVIIAPPTGEDI